MVRDIVHLPKNKKKEYYGGTGGNIAYGAGTLGLSPSLFSIVGKDFNKDYAKHLKKHGVDLKVYIDKKDKTAVFAVEKNEKGICNESWQPNVFNKIENIALNSFFDDKKLSNFKIAIFSPGTPKSTERHMQEFHQKKKNATVIFDPGQMIHTYTKKQLENCIKLSDILILNEFEFTQAEKILKKDLLKLFKNKILIRTLGHKGSLIYEKGKEIRIPVVQARKVLSPVGAGDAYRAGLIYGLINGLDIEYVCNLSAKMASKNVEYLGCQLYKIKKLH